MKGRYMGGGGGCTHYFSADGMGKYRGSRKHPVSGH